MRREADALTEAAITELAEAIGETPDAVAMSIGIEIVHPAIAAPKRISINTLNREELCKAPGANAQAVREAKNQSIMRAKGTPDERSAKRQLMHDRAAGEKIEEIE